MARPELPGAAVPHSVACSSISVGGSHPLFQPSAKNALLFFVWLWYIGLGIVKAALKSSIFLFFLEQLCYFNLSPQGDGNSRTFCRNLRKPSISTYPRKGAKNSASKMVRSFSFACLNFSVFVGFFSMNRAAAAFSLPWLLYCDKMCYNRAKSKHLSQNIQLYSSFVVQLFHNL